METIYTDGAVNISLIDGVVRLDLVSLLQKENEQPVARPVCTLALSLAGFVRFNEQLTKTIDEMKNKGVLVPQYVVSES